MTSWQLKTWASTQAGNRASKTGRYLPWLGSRIRMQCSDLCCAQGAPLQPFSVCQDKKLFTLLDLCVSSLRRGHANLLCIIPILTDDPRRESKVTARWNSTACPSIHTHRAPPPPQMHTRHFSLPNVAKASAAAKFMARGKHWASVLEALGVGYFFDLCKIKTPLPTPQSSITLPSAGR